MCHFRLLFGLVIFLTVANSRADDETDKAPPPVQDDLKKLQGTWRPLNSTARL